MTMMMIMMMVIIIIYLLRMLVGGASGKVAVKVLRYKLEGRGFETL
jgi:hypothetical protein